MTTRVLVLLAARNGAQWIEEQVESILGQRGVEVALVVGDDASTDDTRVRLTKRWGGDTRVRMRAFETSSGSAGASFQRLMREVDATGFDAVALSDQDDCWLPDKLLAAVDILREQGASGYSAAVRAHWPDGRAAVLGQCPHMRRADFLFEGAGQGCTFVLERGFFQRAQGFLRGDAGRGATMHFHDWMVYVLSRAWNVRWVFDPVPRMDYRQHSGNDIGARGGLAGGSRRLWMIRDGWYAEQIAKASAVYVAAGGCDPLVLSLVRELEHRAARGIPASVRLALRLIQDGRRRRVDRAVLACAALARWI